ncbi:MAG: copper amine oxidase N-terminal domain-containing protein [Defluviitaleaceae bacterium]|nr:copper amine oxidase N-terminal domain-containing protein [Defluviitaleaceae bacterium]
MIGERIEPTPPPAHFEIWIGQYGVVFDGEAIPALTVGINEAGFAYADFMGSTFLMEIVDEYNGVFLGRSRSLGSVAQFGVDEGGTPFFRYSGDVLFMLPDAAPMELRFAIGESLFSFNGASHQITHAPFIDVEHERTMVALVDVIAIFGEVDLTLYPNQPLPNGLGAVRHIDGQLFVPLAYVAKTLDLQISWDEANQAVYVK